MTDWEAQIHTHKQTQANTNINKDEETPIIIRLNKITTPFDAPFLRLITSMKTNFHYEFYRRYMTES